MELAGLSLVGVSRLSETMRNHAKPLKLNRLSGSTAWPVCDDTVL